MACDTDVDCLHYGAGVNNVCQCQVTFEGDHCQIRQEMGLWIAYVVVTCVGHLFIVILAFYHLRKIYAKTRHLRDIASTEQLQAVASTMRITVIELISLIAASTLRIIIFGVDAHGRMGIYPKPFIELFTDISYLLWYFSAFLLGFYWIQITTENKMSSLGDLRKLYRMLGALTTSLLIIVFPLCVATSFIVNFSVTMALNASFLFFIVVTLIIVAIANVRMRRMLSQLSDNSTIKKTIAQKIKWYTISGIPVVAILLTVTLFATVPLRTLGEFVAIQFFLRVEEVGVAFCYIMVVRRRENKLDSKYERDNATLTNVLSQSSVL